ncbi:MAG: carboxypeptidase-like regulatory domain-containing protein, partial [Chloracidobacterium sp.]
MRYPFRGLLMSFTLVALLLVTPSATSATEAAANRSEGCSVTGLVTDHRGVPVAYAIISMFRDGDEKEALATASSDRSGKFFLSRLAPGAYRFLAAARGFQTLISDRTELTPGSPAQMTLTLRPAPDGKHSSVNPVKYQNRRNRGIFNAAPVAGEAPALAWQAAAMVGSSGYDTQVALEAAPGLEVGFLLRRDWEGRATTFGGALRYTTENHHAIVRSLASQVNGQVIGDPSLTSGGWDKASAFGLFRRHEVQAADAWQVTPELQLTYGFDYIQIGRSGEDAWLPRLAAHWQPCAQLQFHTALTADGQSTPDWTNPESLLFPSDFPNPPQRLALQGDTPVIARNLRTEVGVAWRAAPKTTVKV